MLWRAYLAERGDPQRARLLALAPGAAVEGEQAGGEGTATLEQHAFPAGPGPDIQPATGPHPGKFGRHDRPARTLARVSSCLLVFSIPSIILTVFVRLSPFL